jgi:hypothetical protein
LPIRLSQRKIYPREVKLCRSHYQSEESEHEKAQTQDTRRKERKGKIEKIKVQVAEVFRLK